MRWQLNLDIKEEVTSIIVDELRVVVVPDVLGPDDPPTSTVPC